MNALPLTFQQGHLFLELDGEFWLLDTGAPASFGSRSLCIAGERFDLHASYLGLTAPALSRFVGVRCAGLLGADVLGRFDHVFDIAGGRLSVSTADIPLGGQSVRLDEFMGIPIVTARVGGSEHRMFFDTGARFSYFQDGSLTQFPYAGSVTDFYPGFGPFETETYEVPLSLGGVAFTLRCGALPALLGMILMMAKTAGIVGNAILAHRMVGYFPRRRVMIL